MGIRLPQADAAALAAMGIDLNQINLAPEPKRPNLTEEELKKLSKVNLKAAWDEYTARVTYNSTDPKVVRRFTEVLAEYNEKEVPGCSEKLADAGMDAYEGQLYARQLAVRGEDAALIGSMVTETSRYLYPEYVRRVLTEVPMIGLDYATVNDIIAGREVINGSAARGMTITSATGPKTYKMGEGAAFRKVEIDMDEQTVNLMKHGVEINLTYEVERRCTLNMLATVIRRQGVEFQKDLAIWGINKLFENATDGSTTAVSGKITSQEFVKQKRAHGHNGYNTDVILYGQTVDEALLANPEFWDPRTAALLLTGKMPNLAGARNLFASETSDLSTSYLMYLDSQTGMIMVEEAGSDIAEAEKIMGTQKLSYYYSLTWAFWVLNQYAARKYQVKA